MIAGIITGGSHMTQTHPQPAATLDSPALPVPLRAPEGQAFLLPPLSLPRRGPQCKRGSHHPCPSILKVRSTGRQGKEVPIDKGPEGKAELPYPGGCKLCVRWAEAGSRARALLAAVTHLAAAKQLDLPRLPGDGSNPVAPTGGTRWATAVTNPSRGRKGARWWTTPATAGHPGRLPR